MSEDFRFRIYYHFNEQGGKLVFSICTNYDLILIYELRQVSGRDTATALANYCSLVKTRPQHQELCALLFTSSVWVL